LRILAFDTCLDKMYVTLADGDKILDSKNIETTKEHYHSAFLISTITNMLKENGLTPQQIDLIATNIGPGSFTGIRACTTVARVFAQAANIKAIGVSSLEILSRINKVDKKTLVALDARKEMAYAAIYDNTNETLAPKAILLEELKEIIAEDEYFILTDNKLQPILGGISYQNQDDDLGKYLIQIANEKITAGNDADWQKLLPLYIQPPPVTTQKLKN